jgi:ribonucleoside-diphosphate reductase alpha chain
MSNEISFFEYAESAVLVKENPQTAQNPVENIVEKREANLETLTTHMAVVSQPDQLNEVGIMEAIPHTYTKIEIFDEVVDYFDGDELAAGVWIDKYSLKNDMGEMLECNPDEMHRRLAREFARIENKYVNPLSEEKIYELFKKFKYIIPQGSPMAGIGNNYQIASLSNCFVIGNDQISDSYGGIMKMDEEQVQLMKRRGGVGHDLSHIRPSGSHVKNCALTSTGVVPFMERYSNSTREVAQDGRRGALMLSSQFNTLMPNILSMQN